MCWRINYLERVREYRQLQYGFPYTADTASSYRLLLPVLSLTEAWLKYLLSPYNFIMPVFSSIAVSILYTTKLFIMEHFISTNQLNVIAKPF